MTLPSVGSLLLSRMNGVLLQIGGQRVELQRERYVSG